MWASVSLPARNRIWRSQMAKPTVDVPKNEVSNCSEYSKALGCAAAEGSLRRGWDFRDLLTAFKLNSTCSEVDSAARRTEVCFTQLRVGPKSLLERINAFRPSLSYYL